METEGHPSVTAGPSISALFRAYYQSQKGLFPLSKWKPRAVTARYPNWNGTHTTPAGSPILCRFAVPVEDSVVEVQGEPRAKLETWRYSDHVVEFAHVGPYSTINTTIAVIRDTMTVRGWEPVEAAYEEQYIRAPGMFFAGDERRYFTIVRMGTRMTEEHKRQKEEFDRKEREKLDKKKEEEEGAK